MNKIHIHINKTVIEYEQQSNFESPQRLEPQYQESQFSVSQYDAMPSRTFNLSNQQSKQQESQRSFFLSNKGLTNQSPPTRRPDLTLLARVKKSRLENAQLFLNKYKPQGMPSAQIQGWEQPSMSTLVSEGNLLKPAERMVVLGTKKSKPLHGRRKSDQDTQAEII